MANKRVNDSVGMKIRHYVYGLIRKSGDVSIKLPSSYELAKTFKTTRSVARYELERLIAQDVLISKPRIGTFTNPYKNYINITPIQKKMMLIGILDGDGQRFCYGRGENLIYSNMGLSLANHNCYVHHISFSCGDLDSRTEEIKNIGLDGIIWHISDMGKYSSANFIETLEKSGIPTVAIAHESFGHPHTVIFSKSNAEEKLSRIFLQEKRHKFLVLANLTYVSSIAKRILYKMQLPSDNLKQLKTTDYFLSKISEFKELLDEGYRPDVIMCGPMFAETIPEILNSYGVDLNHQCRLVACDELNSDDGFTGYIIAPDAAQTTDAAIKMLLELKNKQTYSGEELEVQCLFREVK